MEAHAIANLPLETRNYNQLALLTPGAVTTSPGAFNTGLATFNSGRPYINGNREQANYYLLDGIDNNEFVDNNVAFSPSVDAIQEFNVIANNPSADLGHFLGGVISVSLKSGTNQFHGDAFEFLRNDFFNANEWSRNFSPDPIGEQRSAEHALERVRRNAGRSHQEEQALLLRRLSGIAFRHAGHALAGVDVHSPGGPPEIFPISRAFRCTIPEPMCRCRRISRRRPSAAPDKPCGSSPCINGLSPTALKILGILPGRIFPAPTTARKTICRTRSTPTPTAIRATPRWIGTLPTATTSSRGTHSSTSRSPPINSQPLLYNSNGNNIFPLKSGVISYTRTFSPTIVNEFRAGTNYFPAEGNVQGGATPATAEPDSRPADIVPSGPVFRGLAGWRIARRSLRVRNGGCSGDFPSDHHFV